MGVEAILFDFGHTLMDFGRTEEALRGAYSVIRERLAAWVEDRAPPEIDELVERIAEQVDQMVERSYQQRRLEELDIIELFDEALVKSVRMDPETLEVLEKLKADGFRLGLVSNVSQLPELLHRDIDSFGL